MKKPSISRAGAKPCRDGIMHERDHALLDDENWADFIDWYHRRCNGKGMYYIGEFNAEAALGWLTWLKKYCFDLRKTVRESNDVEAMKDLRKEVDACHRLMDKWQIEYPSKNDAYKTFTGKRGRPRRSKGRGAELPFTMGAPA